MSTSVARLPLRAGVIDLRKGHPKASNLPHAHMAKACRAAAARLDDQSEDTFRLQYPLTSMGTPRFLKQLSRFLSDEYGSPCFEDGLCTTNGVSHGIELACSALARPGDSVWMEAPSYFLAHQIFVDHHLRVCPLESDRHGLDTDALAAHLASGDLGHPPALLYLVPSHGNPSGCVLPLTRRRRLLELAEQYNFVVLCDDVYHLLDWSAVGGGGEESAAAAAAEAGGTPAKRQRRAAAAGAVPRLLELDRAHAARVLAQERRDEGRPPAAAAKDGAVLVVDAAIDASKPDHEDDPAYTNLPPPSGSAAKPADGVDGDGDGRWRGEGRVLSVGSFTKILAPGLRVGWIEASRALITRISKRGYITSGGSVAPFASEIVCELLEDGSQAQVLRELRHDYARSAKALCAALRRADCCTLLAEPTGGFFVWCTLPEGLTAQGLLPIAERHGVVFLPGTACAPSSPPEQFARCIRLCFAYEEVEAIEEGVRRLKLAVDEALAAK